MPTYRFLNTETGEEIEKILKISELDIFREDNPHLQTIISAPAIVGSVSTKDKRSDGFKEVMSKVAEKHPGSGLASEYGRKTSKQIKTEQILKKHRDRKK